MAKERECLGKVGRSEREQFVENLSDASFRLLLVNSVLAKQKEDRWLP